MCLICVHISIQVLESRPACHINDKAQCICGSNTVRFQIDGQIVCKMCETCNLGEGMSLECNNIKVYKELRTIKCITCQEGHFSVDNVCRPCTPKCDVNEVEVRKCTPERNRECQCQKGIYRNPGTAKCTEKCTKCLELSHVNRVMDGECIGMSEDEVSTRLVFVLRYFLKQP